MKNIYSTMKKPILLTVVAAFGLLSVMVSVPVRQAHAQGNTGVITIKLIGSGVSPDATGTVQVIERRRGPDLMTLSARKLPPRSRITVLLTEDQAPGGLPAQFIGEFTTDRKGRGDLTVLTEVVNAFASGSPLADQTDENPNDGVVKGNVPGGHEPPPGGTAVIHALNWIRGYLVLPPGNEGAVNVFGPDENTLVGPPVFISEPALP